MNAAFPVGRSSVEPPADRAESQPAGESSERAAQFSRLTAELAQLERRSTPRPRTPRSSSGPVSDSIGDRAGSSAPASVDKADAQARNICLRLLTGAPRSRSELAAALARKETDPGVAERVLDRLAAVGLIDDAAYAAALVRSKSRDRGLARSALASELRRRGVDAEIAAEALVEVSDDAELSRARLLLGKRVDAAMGAGEEAARRRLVGLLARRGYRSDVAFRAVDDAIAEYLAHQF